MHKKSLLYKWFFISVAFNMPLQAGASFEKLPELQHISRLQDTIKIDSSIIYSSDSAKIILPEIRKPLRGKPVTVQILPLCSIDSIILFVRHSYKKTDTLAHCKKPPFNAIWDYTDLPDQDQIHLQFGYKIFHTNGKTIISKPQPHNWAIDRKFDKSKMKYHSKQILPPDTVIIDGKLDEWKHTPRGKLGKVGTFSIKWSDAMLYFSANIKSDSIFPTDCIELHLDPFRTRSTFADDKHRSIRFSPVSRSYCFVSHKKNDSTFSHCDSIAVLLSEGMQRRIVTGDRGYIIEAALPFYALSDLEFPLLTSGLEVTCRFGESSFVRWAGSGEYNRYNPSEWGTIALHQAMLPLKIAVFIFVVVIGFLCLFVIIKGLHLFFTSERIEKEELRGGSPMTQQIQSCIDQHISEPDLTIDSVAMYCGYTSDTIRKMLVSELECGFNQYLDFRRLCCAKRELWNLSASVENIAIKCGYSSIDEMEEKFSCYLHTNSDRFRAQVSEMTENTEQMAAAQQKIKSPSSQQLHKNASL
jgi:AraC-like DNA-binding protein